MSEALAITELALVSTVDSTISKVSLYPGRAELSRLFKTTIQPGQNVLSISGLPNRMDRDSLRVEGRGNSIIQEVVISTMPTPSNPTTSTELENLLSKKRQIEKALARCEKAIKSLETYLGTVKLEKIAAENLATMLESYDGTAGKLDEKILGLEDELKNVESQIGAEKKRLDQPRDDLQLRVKATIHLFNESEKEENVQILLTYGVDNASWDAAYDIRIDSSTDEIRPIALTYKACIAQNTGEAWTHVPLTLETATPTFNNKLPTLTPWKISLQSPKSTARFKEEAEESDDDMGFGLFDGEPETLQNRSVTVTSKGDVNASFSVQGTSSVPSDGEKHDVTIVKLTKELKAKVEWVVVPKKDVGVHMMAKVKNESEFIMLAGKANIFLDGIFIARTDLRKVNPQEEFDIDLGLDPTIRTTYPSLQKKSVTKSKFLGQQRSSTTSYLQRVEISNAKPSTAVLNLRVVDQVPVSQNEEVVVKLNQPSLPPLPSGSGKKITTNATVTVKESGPKILARWSGTLNDGKVEWVIPKLEAQEKTELALAWDVTVPEKAVLVWSGGEGSSGGGASLGLFD